MLLLSYASLLLLALALTRVPIALLSRRLQRAGGSWVRYLQPTLAPLHALLLAAVVHLAAGRLGRGTDRDVLGLYAATGWLGLRAFTTLLFEWWFCDVRGVVLPRAVRRLSSFVLGYAALLAILNVSADVKLDELALATGVLALAGGLFFQRALRDLWLGVSMSIEKRVVVGDYVRVGALEGEVIGVDWKSTTLVGPCNERLVVPNRALVETPLAHYRRAGAGHRASVEVRVRGDAPPNEVLDALVAAGRDVQHVLREPPPSARLVGDDGGDNRYELTLWVDDATQQRDAESRARAAIWYGLRRAGLVEGPRLASDDDVRKALAAMPIFAVCSPAQVAELAANGRVVRFGRGEALFHQGAPGNDLYVVLSGALDVVLEHGDERTPIAGITAGGFVGERALMTGEPRSATVVAAEDTVTAVIDKANVMAVFKKDPQLASRIAQVMAERDAERASLAREAPAPAGVERSLAERIRTFFAL